MNQVLAVDIGGTKLAAGVVDDAGKLLASERCRTPATDDADALFAALVGLFAPLDLARCDTVGVGCGGPMRAGGELVSPLNIPAWRDFPLRARLADHLGLPVTVDNDAKALALGEGWTGAARGVDNYIGMVVSTGIGGGIVLDGRLLDGAAGNAGHIGHVIVEPRGHACVCGAHGCVEAEASGTAIEKFTGRPAREATPDVVYRTGMLVGRAVANVVSLLDLQLAVVSGSVALGFGDPFFAAAQEELEARACLEFARGARVVPGALGAEGPLVGAARLSVRRWGALCAP